MGKVLLKLAERAEVKTINKIDAGIKIVLEDGYAQEDGATETVVATAHAARLWIQSASNGTVKKTTRTVDGQTVEVEVEPEVERYPGVLPEERKPIWDRPKNWNPSDFEGRDAYRRGYAKKSHHAGDSQAAKDFESGWEQERRLDEARKAKEAANDAIPDAPVQAKAA